MPQPIYAINNHPVSYLPFSTNSGNFYNTSGVSLASPVVNIENFTVPAQPYSSIFLQPLITSSGVNFDNCNALCQPILQQTPEPLVNEVSASEIPVSVNNNSEQESSENANSVDPRNYRGKNVEVHLFKKGLMCEGYNFGCKNKEKTR